MSKIVLISSVPPPMGGIAKWTQRMLDTRLPEGWEIDLVDDKLIGNRDSFGDSVKYNYIDEIKRWTRVWRNLKEKISQRDVLLAHACPIATVPSMIVNYISASVVKRANKKHIIHFRCTVPNLVKSKFQLFLLKRLCNKSDQIICLNNQTKKFLECHTQTPIELIPNFVESNEINMRIVNTTIKNVIYVGGVTKEKGCDQLIEVAKLCPNISFSLVGVVGSDIKELAEGVDNVIFWGVQKGQDLTKLLLSSDVFFFLSRFWGEGFSNAVAEAMASGLPCVVTDWAANADQIDNGKGGIVLSNNNVVKEAVEALKAMSGPDIRNQMSLYNINKVINQYSAEVIIQQYVKCYNFISD